MLKNRRKQQNTLLFIITWASFWGLPESQYPYKQVICITFAIAAQIKILRELYKPTPPTPASHPGY